jgi:hypothetical protein
MKSNTLWALATGLLLGFIVGREFGSRSDNPGVKSTSGTSTAAAAATPTEIPKDWITEHDLNVADQFNGLTPQQRYLVLKLLNEKPSDCGCPHG